MHATGFHGRIFDRVIEAFPGYHVIAFEQRGHGRSEHGPIRHRRVMGEDQTPFLEEKSAWLQAIRRLRSDSDAYQGKYPYLPQTRYINFKKINHIRLH